MISDSSVSFISIEEAQNARVSSQESPPISASFYLSTELARFESEAGKKPELLTISYNGNP